jgi:hypothetical protein
VPAMNRIAVAGFQILAALLFCAIAIYVAESDIDMKWVVIGGLTLLLFGFVCYRTKDFWGNPRYWATFGGWFVLHCVAVVMVQRNRPMIPGMYYGSFGTLESICLLGLLIFLFNK